MARLAYPEASDLRELVRFSEREGSIWMGENRMILMHVAALGALRKDLIAALGTEQARRIMTRMGYASGVRDGELAQRIRGERSVQDAFLTGPQLHMLEGLVRVKPVSLELDVEHGKFYGEFIWENAWEEDVHHPGDPGDDGGPICWSLIGYASGYTSTFMGRFILFKEVECLACGHNACRIVGKPLEEWEDAADYVHYFAEGAVINRLLEMRSQIDYLRSSLLERCQKWQLVGSSFAFGHAIDLVSRASATQVTVLLLGETGVGKERFARLLHQESKRRDGPFVAINCAAMPSELIESELFGVEKGAFTGANASRMGKFERADGGTLFLDEVGELPLAAQAKLLRVVQEGEVERIGDDRPRKINVRLVAATNVDLEQAVKEGRFRADLYYRLNVYPVRIPPLRERLADIPSLVEDMLERFCIKYEKRLQGISDLALQALKRHPWPGNIRELQNTIERGVILAPAGGWIEVSHLSSMLGEAADGESAIAASGSLQPKSAMAQASPSLLDDIMASGISLDELEKRLLDAAVSRSSGNLAAAARLLGITRPQLQYRLKKREGEPA